MAVDIKQQLGRSNLEEWVPQSNLGKLVKDGKITDIDYILDRGLRIFEPEIVDMLVPQLHVELLEVGQSKGKFGGGKSSIWKQTQKKTREGTTLKFSTFAVVGNKDGYVGIGYGDAKETVPAREKAIRQAKLHLIKIRRGCGAWDTGRPEANSIPFQTMGKCGSVRVILYPAPLGAGLRVQKQCQKILELCGIRDVYSQTFGKTGTRLNLFRACFAALKHMSEVKVTDSFISHAGMVEGRSSS